MPSIALASIVNLPTIGNLPIEAKGNLPIIGNLHV